MLNLLFLDVALPFSDLAEVSGLGLGGRLSAGVILLVVSSSNRLVLIPRRRLYVALPVVTFKVSITALTLTLALVTTVLLSRHFFIHLREVFVTLSNRLVNEQANFINVLRTYLSAQYFL